MITKRDLLAAGSALISSVIIPLPASAAPIVVRVPISFAANGMPLLKLTIKGKGPYTFLLDTGAFSSLIKEPLAKELGLMGGGHIRVGSLKGYEDSYIYRAQDVVIGGGFKVPNMTFIGAAKFPMQGIDGVLPASILTAMPTELDYEASEIRFYLNGAEMDLDGFQEVDAFFQADREDFAEKVYVNLTIGKNKLVCCLDTGAGSTLLVASAYVEDHHWWEHFPLVRESVSVGGNGEKLKTRVVTAADINIGGVHIDKMPITLSDPAAMNTLERADIDGLIGTPLLRKFTIAFAAHKKLYLKPNAGFALLGQALPETLMSGPVEAAPGTAVVPFLYGDDRKIIIPGRVAGKPPLPFILASGQAFSSIKPQTATDMGLTAGTDGGFSGAGLEFNGGLTMPGLRLKAEAGRAQRGNGYLGLDFLRALPSLLDFDANQLVFFTHGAPDTAEFSRLSLVKAPDGAGPGLYVTVKLDGQDMVCRLDTCIQMGVFLPPHTVKARVMWDKYPDAEGRRLTNDDGKAIPGRYIKMAGGLDLDGHHIAVAPVTMAHPGAADEPEDVGVDAVIGMGVLHRYNIVFSPDGNVYVKPNRYFT